MQSLSLSLAQFSVASYSVLRSGGLIGQIDALSQNGVGLGLPQAQELALHQSVLAQENADPSGFSATVFREVASGTLTIAFRGTEFSESNDLLADADILFQGAAYGQIVSMVNWWRRVGTLAGEMVPQYRVVSYQSGAAPTGAVILRDDGFATFVLENAPTATASGEVEAAFRGQADQRVDVTGHSLGGHLAMAFSALFAAQTNQVVVFNAPGFKDTPGNQTFFAALGGAVPAGDEIVNVAADEALVDSRPLNLIAGLHSRPGQPVNIAIEDQLAMGEPQPFGALNHSMATLMDSLAVYRLLSDLGSEAKPVGQADYKLILGQAAQLAAGGYERIVDALQVFFDVDRGLLEVGNPRRDQLYEAIYGLQANANYRSWVGKLEVRPIMDGADVLLANAATQDEGLAYRFAISELSPFILLGPNLYAPFEPGGDKAGLLDLYDAATNPFGVTSSYLLHRAALLERKLYMSSLDLDKFYQHPVTSDTGIYPNAPDERGRTYQSQGRNYEDRESAFIASSQANHNSVEHLIFGRGEPDDVRGGAKPDYLFGGEGSDYLEGKGDADHIEGGRGLDLYAYTAHTVGAASNDGADTILDVDGDGVIRYSEASGSIFNPVTNSRVIADASVRDTQSPAKWRSADGKFTYSKESNEAGGVDLVITFSGVSGGSIRLKGFRDGDFGIYLWESRADPLIARTVMGTEVVDRLSGERLPPGGGDRIDGLAGNDVILSDRPGGAPDNGSGDSDWILGGEGRDDIDAGAEDDRVEAGVDGELNGDIGGDLVYGNAGDDELYADRKIDLDKAIAQGDSAVSLAQKGDVLSGGAGNDWLIGGAAKDALLGGGGRDLIISGAGDDDLFGDVGGVAIIFAWSVSRDDGSSSGVVEARLNGFAGADTSPGDADVIYAGRGVDWAFGGAGDDFIDGGPDNDLLFGEAGADVLIGGTGDDYLVGDNPGIVAPAAERGDYLDGSAGNDTLEGDGGDDILVGGPGNDRLIGGAGKDIYVFKRGDGFDNLVDAVSGPDRSMLVRDTNFDPSQLTIRPGSMILDFGGGDSVAIASFDHNDPNSPEAFESLSFADGTRLSFADVLAIGFTVNGTSASDDGTTSPVIMGTALRDKILAFEGNDEVQAREGNDDVDGGLGNDRLFGGEGNDHLVGGIGHDILSGDAGEDVLEGGDGNDWLWGGTGDDYLNGGGGLDQLFGGPGDDTYVFNTDSYALDTQGAVRVVFGAHGGVAIDPGDISLTRELINGSPAYVIRHAAAPAHGMRIWLSDDAQIAAFEFADGPVFDHEALLRETWVDQSFLVGGVGADLLQGYAGGDFLRGGEGDDTLHGHGGSDRIEGGDGNDLLLGGSGDDLLYGGAGDDGYVMGASEGHDVIEDDTGLDTVTLAAERADATLVRLPNGDLSIALLAGGTVTVIGQYIGEARKIERLVFADVTVEIDEVDSLTVAPIGGTPGSDVLLGTQYGDLVLGLGGDDFLDGGAGEDLLEGGSGVDTYRLRLSGGVDRALDDGLQPSVLQLDAGVGFAHLALETAGDDLVVSVPGTATGMILTDYYAGRDSWTVRMHTGEQMSGAELIEYLARIEAPVTLAEWRDRYTEFAKVTYLAYLASFDYSGRVAFHDLGMSDGPFIQPPRTFYETISSENRTSVMNIGVLAAGGSDSLIDLRGYGALMIDAGGGDDLIINLGWGVSFRGTEAWGSFLYGAAGDDTIFGTWASDIIIGGDGSDYMDGSQGHDVYVVFHTDAGVDIIDEVSGDWFRAPNYYSDNGGGRYSTDVLQFVGVNFSDVSLSLGAFDSSAINDDGMHNVYSTLDINYGTGTVRVLLPGPWIAFLDYNEGDLAGIETIRFSDGVTLALDEIFDGFAVSPLGLPGDEADLRGSAADDRIVPLDRELRTAIHGLAGNDYVEGGFADDFLDGGEGSDVIHGHLGDDIITGGPGDDLSLGGAGADIYIYRPGDGVDRVFDPSVGGQSNVVRFGEGIMPSDLSLGVGSLTVRIGTGGEAMHFESFDPKAPFGARDVDRFLFWDGTDLTYEELIARGFDITGTQGDNVLSGTATVDRIRGGRGSDVLAGGAGSDTYFYEVGDGLDRILEGDDAGGIDVLRMGGGIAPDRLSITRSIEDLIIAFPETTDQVILAGWFAIRGGTIERAEFADGHSWTGTELESRVVIPNRVPQIVFPLADQVAVEDESFIFAVPFGAFTDPDVGDALVFDAKLQDGSALPAWLTFDSGTQTLGGIPLNGDVGSLDIVITATDGRGASVADTFRLEILNTNDAPTVAAPVADQRAVEGVPFSFTIPSQTFHDPDAGDALSYIAAALPNWLTLDPQGQTFAGTPSALDVGTVAVRITATDQYGAFASDTFDLAVASSSLSLGEKIRELVFQGSNNSGGVVSRLIQALLAAQAQNLLGAMASFSPPAPPASNALPPQAAAMQSPLLADPSI